MSHPRVEEVSDSDVDMSDPSEGDIDDFVEADIMRRVDDNNSKKPPAASAAPPPSASQPQHQQQQQPPRQQQQQRQQQPPAPQQPRGYPQMHTTTDDSAYKAYQCLYPVYFDASRTRAEGRRVPRSLAVRNPLATEIVRACAEGLRLPTVLEAGKLHPKDWANPGRVKVDLRSQQSQSQSQQTIKNKHHLYLLVARHLRAHPTTDASPALRVVVRGAPPPPPRLGEGENWPRPAVPRGWKMGELLPYYSPAMTGGGVSENFLKDMMKEMGAAGAGGGDMASLLAGAASMAGGAGAGAGSGSGAGGAGGAGGGGKKGKGKGR